MECEERSLPGRTGGRLHTGHGCANLTDTSQCRASMITPFTIVAVVIIIVFVVWKKKGRTVCDLQGWVIANGFFDDEHIWNGSHLRSTSDRLELMLLIESELLESAHKIVREVMRIRAVLSERNPAIGRRSRRRDQEVLLQGRYGEVGLLPVLFGDIGMQKRIDP